MDKFRNLGKYKPLCHTETGLLLYKNKKIYLMDYDTENIKDICYLKANNIKNFLASKNRLFERMFRSYARASIAINNGALVTYNSGIYYIDFGKKMAKREHEFREGMKSPISFSEIKSIKGFDDCIAYGEYTGNPLSGPVAVYTRNKHGKWSTPFTFKSGTVRHIHAIIPDQTRGNVLILTGDADNESGFWIAEDNFNTVRPLLLGKQLYRSCTAWPTKEEILYATDIPSENNYLCVIRESNNWKPEKIYEMPGPCLFSAKNRDTYYFSTCVEPDSSIRGKRRYITCKLGKGVKERKSYIIAGNLKKGFKPICSFNKDIWPMVLFEYGNVMFPSGSSSSNMYLYPNSVFKYDGHLLTLKN